MCASLEEGPMLQIQIIIKGPWSIFSFNTFSTSIVILFYFFTILFFVHKFAHIDYLLKKNSLLFQLKCWFLKEMNFERNVTWSLLPVTHSISARNASLLTLKIIFPSVPSFSWKMVAAILLLHSECRNFRSFIICRNAPLV